MLKVLQALIGNAPRDGSAKKPAPNATAKPATAGNDYRAVSVVSGIKCCSAAKDIAGKSYLFREGPRLPLVNCTMPTKCSCKFKKASDRRDDDRRQIGAAVSGHW